MRSLVLLLLGSLLVVPAAGEDNAPERVRRHTLRMSYLDNGVIRLGIDLNLGGAITYLSRSGTDENVVNSYDCGRQIQMSYYSGPVPFSTGDKQPKPNWAHIGWNPIQVGDAFGNPSKVLEHRNDGKQLYVKCIPMHWPLDNVPGECTYECWLELEGNAVHARCRMENHRPDHTQYSARFQEFPAIYTNGPWYRLMTYTGDQPFTGAPLARIERDKTAPGPWSHWISPEHWAALVDDHDFGLGVWSPDFCNFDGGFAGKPGAGGPQDGPTGYIAPHALEIIDWNIQHEYRYDLILGRLPDIRRYVYDHAPRPKPPVYRFEKDRQDWIYVNATDAGWPIRGELNILMEQNDPQLIGPVGFWQASDAGTLVIEAASRTKQTNAQVFWKPFGEKHFTDRNAARFQLTSDGAFHAYRLKFSNEPGWKGPITQLRFDPIGSGTAGDWIRIRSIRLEK
ncbi:MAG TPA: hypothetical protein VLJ39_02375 [Tepidisphaeraceae bacterium]|nr:hypothetical protein [Tepidisphaeraceae bacterium]